MKIKKDAMNNKVILFLMCFGCFLHIDSVDLNNKTRRQYVGIFKNSDPTLSSIKYGNWGSRPYEYAWTSSVVSIKNKKVIDLGVGLPSQYNWYQHVMIHLRPAFYVGIDFDSRILNELIMTPNYEIKYMNMAELHYQDKSFDIAYCISTFEHIPYEIFMKSIEEAYRVLKDDGMLVITLDEEWDKNELVTHDNGWNTLEQSLMKEQLFERRNRSFGLPEFLNLIKDYFVPYQDDAIVNLDAGIIYSKNDQFIYYERTNKDTAILNSGLTFNSCVSYALLKKKG